MGNKRRPNDDHVLPGRVLCCAQEIVAQTTLFGFFFLFDDLNGTNSE